MNNRSRLEDAKCSHLYAGLLKLSKLVGELGLAIRMVILLPIVSVATSSGAEVTLTWNDNASNETGFQIERSTDGSSFSVLGTVAADVTAYIDETTLPSSTYWYRVSAYNEFGSSGYTNVVNHTTEPEVNTAPTIIGLSNQTVDADSGISGPFPFTINDEETAADQLLVSAMVSNGSLIPSQNITITGSGTNRNITIVPAAGSTGSCIITVYVTDGVNTSSDSFTVTVSPVASFVVSDPPSGSTYHLGDSVTIDLSVLGGADLVSVTYFLEGIPVAVVEEAPFTRNIGLPVTGTLEFYVVAQLSDGSELSSQPVQIDVQDMVAPSGLTVSRFP